jgi:hypothetical protein
MRVVNSLPRRQPAVVQALNIPVTGVTSVFRGFSPNSLFLLLEQSLAIDDIAIEN